MKHWLFQFQVTILETGSRLWPGVGVVEGEYDTSQMPGWREESVGYHTDDGKIYYNDTTGRETTGVFRNSVNKSCRIRKVFVSAC